MTTCQPVKCESFPLFHRYELISGKRLFQCPAWSAYLDFHPDNQRRFSKKEVQIHTCWRKDVYYIQSLYSPEQLFVILSSTCFHAAEIKPNYQELTKLIKPKCAAKLNLIIKKLANTEDMCYKAWGFPEVLEPFDATLHCD